MFDVGDVFNFEIEYEDISNGSKIRSVIIVDRRENEIILVSTTSKGPKNPPSYFDRFKILICNWRRIGFKEPSWAKGYRLIKLSEKELSNVVKNDLVGQLGERDLAFLIGEIERIHN